MNATYDDCAAEMQYGREVLLEAIHKYLERRVEVTGDGSGAHVVLWPLRRIAEDIAIGQAAMRGLAFTEYPIAF